MIGPKTGMVDNERIGRVVLDEACEKVINYDTLTATIRAIASDIVRSEPTSAKKLTIQRDKIQIASEKAKSLDNWQLIMCKIEKNLLDRSEFDKDLRVRSESKKYRTLRLATISLLTQWSNSLAAFKSNYKSEESNLFAIIERLSDFSLLIESSILPLLKENRLWPCLIMDLDYLLRKRKIHGPLGENIILKALEIAKIKAADAREIIG